MIKNSSRISFHPMAPWGSQALNLPMIRHPAKILNEDVPEVVTCAQRPANRVHAAWVGVGNATRRQKTTNSAMKQSWQEIIYSYICMIYTGHICSIQGPSTRNIHEYSIMLIDSKSFYAIPKRFISTLHGSFHIRKFPLIGLSGNFSLSIGTVKFSSSAALAKGKRRPARHVTVGKSNAHQW